MTIGELLTERDILRFQHLLKQLGVMEINVVQQWAAIIKAAYEAADEELTQRSQDRPVKDRELSIQGGEQWQALLAQPCPRRAPLTLWEGRLGETWVDFGPQTFTINDRHAFTVWSPFAAVKRMLEHRLGKCGTILFIESEGARDEHS